MSVESGMYLYPWEIDNFASFEKQYSATGCNSLAPALSYHQGDVLYARSGHFRTLRDAALGFTPKDALYGRVKPKVFEETARAGTLRALRGWCSKTGRKFSGWVVLLNNASLGDEHPDLCVENLFGDYYTHSLCPSHPDVREYAAALLTDICEELRPDSVMIESIGPRPAGTGPFGAIANVGITTAVRWLWSLCFCPDCMSRAAELMRGLEPQALREKAKKLGLRLLNSELGGAANEDALAAMLMLEEPELLRYQEARQLMLAEFIGEISEQLCQRGAESRIIPSAVPFDINKVYLEGLSFSAAEGKAGMWMPLVYGPGETYGMVRNTIRLFDSQTSVGMAATLLREADRDSFCATLLTARASGCDTFFIYNYSLASQERLSWVAKFNEALLA